MAALVPSWTAPRSVSHATLAENNTPISAEIEQARQRALRMSRRLTQSNRKSTIGLELKKLELDQIQAQIDDLSDSVKMADQSKRHSRMIKEKMGHDLPPSAHINAAAEGRRTVMKSIKLSKGWGDESPEWKAMMAKEREMEAKEEADRIALEKRIAEVEAATLRRQKLRKQERSKQQNEQMERLKRQLAELEAALEKEAEEDEASLLAEFERRKAEAQARAEQQRRERERQRQEDEKLRREREEALARRKREMENKERELQELLWRKEEERLMADQQRLDNLRTMIDDPNAAVPASILSQQELELKRKSEEVRLREERVLEFDRKCSMMAKMMEKIPDIDKILRLLEQMQLDPAAFAREVAVAPQRKTAEVYKAEIAELQKVLMNGTATAKELDDANIKLEKLMQEYEKTPEYKAEIERAAHERRARNEQPNAEALQRMKVKYSVAAVQSNPDLVARIAAHPELRMLYMEPQTILRIYEKDYAKYTLRGLDLDELRALAALMPKNFAPTQKIQLAWIEGLHDKIDSMASSPTPVPPQPKKNPTNPPRLPAAPRRNNNVGGGGDIFEEIRRRGGKAAAAAAASSTSTTTPPPAPLLQAPSPLSRARPPLPPAPKLSCPPPSLATPPAPPASPSFAPLTQQVQTSLERLVKILSQATLQHGDKEAASETRTLVSATKQLAEAVQASGRTGLSHTLRDATSELVVAVRAVVVARRSGPAEAATAKTMLVKTIDTLRRCMRELNNN